MLKKFSRRPISVFAIACLMLSVVCLWRAELGNAFSQFALRQQLQVVSDGWNNTCEADYTRNRLSCFGWFFGNSTIFFNADYGDFKDFIIYDLAAARFVEGFLVDDRPL